MQGGFCHKRPTFYELAHYLHSDKVPQHCGLRADPYSYHARGTLVSARMRRYRVRACVRACVRVGVKSDWQLLQTAVGHAVEYPTGRLPGERYNTDAGHHYEV